MPFWPFLAINNGFLLVFKNTDKNNICVSIVFKAKTKEKYEENVFLRLLFQNSKMRFFGGQPFFYSFFSVLAFKTIDAQMLFWSVFLKSHTQKVINPKKRPKWHF